ncbi:MHYT domain-containing protein [Bdellovibrio sp. HCB337]|uniref:MHYT domain-containing protein n=1 Tax=Bdellovibrio sp. HCB337 TaxID=3394358 RepID=UPI0039A44AF4
METQFNLLWVTLSVLVAIFASYVALNLAQNVTQSKGRERALWLGCGALAMGIGIWSMHFVGMLAFEMPGMEMAYDIPLMVLSVLVAVVASALALFIVSRPVAPFGSIFAGGIAMAAAIAGMHYIGMASMRMAATIQWNFFLIVLSVLIALVASFGALLILIRLRDQADHFKKLLLASTVMGIAISGMHYTGMFAATYIHTESSIESSNLLVSSGLATTVVAATLLILGLALVSSIGQRMWLKKSQQVDEKLGESEEKFRRLVEAVKDYAIIMLDTDGAITTWNSGAKRITGYTDSEIIGKQISAFYIQRDIDNQTAMRELVAAREIGHFEGEGQRVRKDGSTYWASVVVTPLYNSAGTLTGFSKVIRDITRVKEAEARMKRLNVELEERVRARTKDIEAREKQLRSVADAVPVLIAQFNREEQVLFANDAFCDWFHQSHDSVLGKSFAELLGEDRYHANKPYVQRVLSGETISYERDSRSGSRVANMGITLVPEFDAQHGTIMGFIVVASNITKYKEIQTELSRAKEAAEVANATKSAFLANMSHEIRTPLGAVLGFSELLLDGQMTASERVNSIEIIKRNGRLLSNIINDILDLSKVEAGRLDFEKSEVAFTDIMKELNSILSLEAAEKGIELKVSSLGGLPSHIKTDALRLRQILFNIVGNAIKFTNRGSVHVKVTLILDAKGATKLAFIITDTGEGIKPEQIDRLFKPFAQADASTTRKFGGTGLGLVLSKKLAMALGGDVVLTDSAPGKGSTFTVTIDPGFSEQVLFHDAEPKVINTWHSTQWRSKGNLSNLKILVVDDSIDNQILIKKILRLAGANVEVASNGKEGVEKALNGDFSVVLMDLQMPEMDGYEATQVLRNQGYTKPIIALTAHAMKEERQKSLQSGFDNHLTKPVDNVELVKALEDYSA